MSVRIELVAKELIAARARRKEAKDALRVYRQKNGACESLDDSYFPDGGGLGACYSRYPSLPMESRCEVCQGSEPLWQARQKAAAEVGSAMRRLTNLCNKASQSADVKAGG